MWILILATIKYLFFRTSTFSHLLVDSTVVASSHTRTDGTGPADDLDTERGLRPHVPGHIHQEYGPVDARVLRCLHAHALPRDKWSNRQSMAMNWARRKMASYTAQDYLEYLRKDDRARFGGTSRPKGFVSQVVLNVSYRRTRLVT